MQSFIRAVRVFETEACESPENWPVARRCKNLVRGTDKVRRIQLDLFPPTV